MKIFMINTQQTTHLHRYSTTIHTTSNISITLFQFPTINLNLNNHRQFLFLPNISHINLVTSCLSWTFFAHLFFLLRKFLTGLLEKLIFFWIFMANYYTSIVSRYSTVRIIFIGSPVSSVIFWNYSDIFWDSFLLDPSFLIFSDILKIFLKYFKLLWLALGT